ncbi:MAG: heme lyase CcmF/NrfE family subunit [Ferrimicrobium sp.]|jgi:cytochrome c-type biogenesis protein CcmF|uniref:Heme lyase CcmF/NrfE family subunit n=1 Tax=Ferrimicrobium acidiphilum TaxID=121039 RepID=A0ABV3Y2Q8_9ACTN|nr:heme lyase CcmF/NrfE family subunit [Ferrimicrobium sp.]
MFDAALGSAGLVLAFVFGLLGTLGSLIGAYQRNERLMSGARTLLLIGFFGTIVSTFAMEQALVSHDFSLAYVVANNSKETPLLFSITGMWSALQGSLLLWAIVQGLYIALLAFAMRHEADRRTGSVALGILGVVFTYFSGLLLFAASPFLTTVGTIPADGRGPNPLLQDYPLVAIHPPMLYMGFVGMSVPFALLSAALITGRLNNDWITRVRNWSLITWVFLTIGIVLGAWWSYQVLGWGGYWAWDPVENSALLPWLCGIAFIHSVLIDRRRKRMGIASFSLVSAAFALTILGTYFTRSGVLQSVHAFSDSSLGTVLILFFVAVVIFEIGLSIFAADRLMGQARFPLLSRPGSLLINNAIFGLLTLVILAGTVYPLFAHYFNHQTVDVGAPFFDAFVIPLFLVLLAIMAIGPWLNWRRTPPELIGQRLLLPGAAAVLVVAISAFAGVTALATLGAYALATFVIVSSVIVIYGNLARSSGRRASALVSRSSAGMLTHIGVAIIAIGMASATTFGHQGSVKMVPGQTVHVYGQTLKYEGVETVVTPAKTSFEANVVVNGGNTYHPAITQFGTYATAVGTPSVNVGLTRDVYLTIDAAPTTDKGPITLGIVVQPLIFWLWAGAGVMVLGGLLSVVGIREQNRRRRGNLPASDTPVEVTV